VVVNEKTTSHLKGLLSLRRKGYKSKKYIYLLSGLFLYLSQLVPHTQEYGTKEAKSTRMQQHSIS